MFGRVSQWVERFSKEQSASVRPNMHKIAVRVYAIPDTHNHAIAIFERVIIVAGTVTHGQIGQIKSAAKLSDFTVYLCLKAF